MDDTEDDARYPPDSYPLALHRHRASSSRGKPLSRGGPFPPLVPPGYPPNHDDDVDSEVDEEEEDDNNPDDDDPEEEEEEEEEEDEEERGGSPRYRDESSSSPESRGKRRKLDRYALGFEFAPRHPPPKAPVIRNNVADWSEDSTFVLLDAWGELFVKNGRKSLRSDEWSEVARKVNRSASRATLRSDSQCRNRIDTLKKKYKKEKARGAGGIKGYGSKWVYFKRMEELMDAPLPQQATVARHPLRLPCGLDSGKFVFTDSGSRLNRPNGLDELMDSPAGSESMGEDEDDDSDGLPPPSIKRRSRGGMDVASFRMLADSIQRFGEIYEKIENSKRQHMVELERMRREFQRDLEVQKRQILERAQAELAKIRQEEGEEEEESEEDERNNDGRGVNGSVDKVK